MKLDVKQDYQQLCGELLTDWCEALLKLQIKDTGNKRLDGAVLCPACNKIHGRCFEAMYPFLYMAELKKDNKWIQAADQLFSWAENVVSQEDGSFLNDIEVNWKGTTVFNTIQLADCLLFHGKILPPNMEKTWKNRLRRSAEFLYEYEELNDNNINYPVSNALALYECGIVFGDDRYTERAEKLARLAEHVVTDHGLIFGEGIPRFHKSPKGCVPVDIGYNTEETVPSLALYGVLSGNGKVCSLAEKALCGHLDFMLENGAWDNSFGTRNYKWTYWGSRTSDGCGLGYLLFAGRHLEFALAAAKNLTLLKECTHGGLLYGGYHYYEAGQPPCVHHTFTHAKVLAGILDRKLWEGVETGGVLPRERDGGIRYYPETDTWLVNRAIYTATVTAYDWEYLPGGHVSGGTLSLFHHKLAGTLLCAGMSRYSLKEPANMQIPYRVRHECLALRIEKNVDGHIYSSIYDTNAQVNAEGKTIVVRGILKDIGYREEPGKDSPYYFKYQFEEDKVVIQAGCPDGRLVCPVVSRQGENVITEGAGTVLKIKKKGVSVRIEGSGHICLPYGKERIFNLVPGLEALRMEMMLGQDVTGIQIEVQVNRNDA